MGQKHGDHHYQVEQYPDLYAHMPLSLTDLQPPVARQSARHRPVEKGKPGVCSNPIQKEMVMGNHLQKSHILSSDNDLLNGTQKGATKADLEMQSPGWAESNQQKHWNCRDNSQRLQEIKDNCWDHVLHVSFTQRGMQDKTELTIEVLSLRSTLTEPK